MGGSKHADAKAAMICTADYITRLGRYREFADEWQALQESGPSNLLQHLQLCSCLLAVGNLRAAAKNFPARNSREFPEFGSYFGTLTGEIRSFFRRGLDFPCRFPCKQGKCVPRRVRWGLGPAP